MFKYIENFLTEEELQHIREISLIETSGNNVCHAVSLYQSFNNMHEKYQDDIMQSIVRKCEKEVSKILGDYVKTKFFWFNRTAEDSDYDWHTHSTGYPSIVLYLSGCEGRGTIFEIGEAEFTANVQDNSCMIFDSRINHRTPNWTGVERMTVAIDYESR
jgi:hypothetical protein